MRKQSELYGKVASGKGLTYEGRGMFDLWKGSLQPPSFFVSQQTVEFLGWVQVNDPYLGVLRARKFKLTESTFIDVVDRQKDEPQRIGGIAFWLDSYTEQKRKGARISNFVSKTKIYERLVDLAHSYSNDFIDALLIYYTGILQEGDYGYEQFVKDLTSKKDSSCAFDGFAKNRDVLASPNIKTIYAREVKETKSEVQWLIDHLNLAKLKQYSFGLIDPNFLINALRQRQPKRFVTEWTPFEIILESVLYRARSAGGVDRISRLSWPIYHTPVKSKIIKKMNDFLSAKFKLVIHNMDVDGVEFYISAAASVVNCYDVSNAEKTWGCVFFDLLPGIVDSSDDSYPLQYAPQLQSGIDITRIINWFGVLLLIEDLRRTGKLPKDQFDVWMGGDNFAFKIKLEKLIQKEGEAEDEYLNRLIIEEDGLWHIIDEDNRILGFNPIKGRIDGLHHNIDGVDSMVGWNAKYNSFKWTQSKQTLSRIADSVIQLDLFQKGTCLLYYKWIMESGIKSYEAYNHDDIWADTGGKFLEVMEAKIPGLTEWIKASFNVDEYVSGRYVDSSDCDLRWFNTKERPTAFS